MLGRVIGIGEQWPGKQTTQRTARSPLKDLSSVHLVTPIMPRREKPKRTKRQRDR